MPPLLSVVRRTFSPGVPSSELSEQWSHPSDVFSVLLIVGGDVVARALAQLAGSCFTPVAFSFGTSVFVLFPVGLIFTIFNTQLVLGWVAYGTSAIVSAVGENKLVPPADFACMVINGENGYVRNNSNWIIGRLVRDYNEWKDRQPRAANAADQPDNTSATPVADCVESILERKWELLRKNAEKKGRPIPERPPKAGLCVSVYRARRATKGYPGYDAPYITGCLTCVVQLGVAAIPCGIYGDWSILMLTASGTVLALATGALTQWSREKWACRSDTKKAVVLTTGNGSQHAIVIQGAGVGLDLEDLAAAETGLSELRQTRAALIVLGILWVVLLICATGISKNTWFLLAVGGLGMAQNIYAAGKSRMPEAFGLPLEFVEVFGEPKVMETLFAVENKYPRLGKSMLATFFTGDLNEKERTAWLNYDSLAKSESKAEGEKKVTLAGPS